MFTPRSGDRVSTTLRGRTSGQRDLEALRVVATRRAKATMLDPQEPTMTDRPRIVITEHDQVLLDTADPATYTILDHAANLLAALGDDLTTRLERDLEHAAR